MDSDPDWLLLLPLLAAVTLGTYGPAAGRLATLYCNIVLKVRSR